MKAWYIWVVLTILSGSVAIVCLCMAPIPIWVFTFALLLLWAFMVGALRAKHVNERKNEK